MRSLALLLVFILLPPSFAGYVYEPCKYVVRVNTIIEGKVFDLETGEGIPALILGRIGSENVQARAGDNGYFRLELPWADLRYDLGFRYPGYEELDEQGSVQRGEYKFLSIGLKYDPFDLKLENYKKILRGLSFSDRVVGSYWENEWRPTGIRVSPDQVLQNDGGGIRIRLEKEENFYDARIYRLVPVEWKADVYESVPEYGWKDTGNWITLKVDQQTYNSVKTGDLYQYNGKTYRVGAKWEQKPRTDPIYPGGFPNSEGNAFQPPHRKGDRELMAKSDRPCNVRAWASLGVSSDGHTLQLTVYLEEKEPRKDWTEFYGQQTYNLYHTPWKITGIQSDTYSEVSFQDYGGHTWFHKRIGPGELVSCFHIWGDSVGEDQPKLYLDLNTPIYINVSPPEGTEGYYLNLFEVEYRQVGSREEFKGTRTFSYKPEGGQYRNVSVSKYSLERLYSVQHTTYRRDWSVGSWPEVSIEVKVLPKNGYGKAAFLKVVSPSFLSATLERERLTFHSTASTFLRLRPSSHVLSGTAEVTVLGYDENMRLVENRRVRLELLTPAPPPSTTFSVREEAIPVEPSEISPPPPSSPPIETPQPKVPAPSLQVIPDDAWTNPYGGYVFFQVVVPVEGGPSVVSVRLEPKPEWSLQEYFQKAAELAEQQLMEEKSKKSKR